MRLMIVIKAAGMASVIVVCQSVFAQSMEPAPIKKSPNGLIEGDNAERYYESEADLSRRILSRAGALLNEEQYNALAKFQDRHLAAEKAGVEALRRMIQQSQPESGETP
jgi:hypothetical protein